MAIRQNRNKVSTTISPEAYAFLEQMIESGKVRNLSEAIDTSISKVMRMENRKRLALATARYFDEMEPAAAIQERDLARDLESARGSVDFDTEL